MANTKMVITGQNYVGVKTGWLLSDVSLNKITNRDCVPGGQKPAKVLFIYKVEASDLSVLVDGRLKAICVDGTYYKPETAGRKSR